MKRLEIIVHNIRSTHNVGSILRSAEGFGVDWVYFTGYSPYPQTKKDGRLPHLARKIDAQISKTALGAEKSANWSQYDDVLAVIGQLRLAGYQIAVLEQTPLAVELKKYKPKTKVALLLGSEVEGVDKSLLKLADIHLQIPMKGQKESFNVAVAAAVAMYHLSH